MHIITNSNRNAGGKANSLIKLKNCGINVPNFFVVTEEVLAEFLRANNLLDNLGELSNSQLTDAVGGGQFPDDLAAEIYDAFDAAGFDLVSCRSSADNEDGSAKSFAGQYESYLNVSREHLLDNIKKCWQSLYADNVAAYSGEKADYRMNVIVQQMIEADYAGVAFSVDPTLGSQNYSSIEIVKGLGESLVSGEITPTRLSVRRQTGTVDLKTGEINLPDDLIQTLEREILRIEDIYQLPVDIEWALRGGELFILQTRPITALDKPIVPYQKLLSREKNLWQVELYARGEYDGIRELTGGLYYFRPLIICRPDAGLVEFYYNELSLEELPSAIYNCLDNNFPALQEYYERVLAACRWLESAMNNDEKVDLALFAGCVLTTQPFSSLGSLVGSLANVPPRVFNLLSEYRDHYDYIIYKSEDWLNKYLSEKLPENQRANLPLLTWSEIVRRRFPSPDTIEKRRAGWLYFGKLEHYNDLNDWLKKHQIRFKNLQNDNSSDVKGTTAFGGNADGIVKQILRVDDFAKFNQGDILVTTMTTPKFTPILSKAAAIVTDEGGMTSHAAIIAREMKIPTIVGCGDATAKLRDGMRVNVNADDGVAELL
ncbi:MAG: hypothetical protein LBM73_03255 [Candidatus Nomurabacteria bacterium]|jgi:phosphohistidine swiveling domain-containing protein|nr:hypothetical protein [Candidatus Nomurabacteria bacterium]